MRTKRTFLVIKTATKKGNFKKKSCKRIGVSRRQQSSHRLSNKGLSGREFEKHGICD
jgi:hypothetical protein